METVRIIVKRIDLAFRADSSIQSISAVGSTAQEAAENARLLSLAAFGSGTHPSRILVQFDGPACGFVQSIHKPISLADVFEDGQRSA